jgi:hypothetical protein
MARKSKLPGPPASDTPLSDAPLRASASDTAKVAQCLMVYAELCRGIAAQSRDEESAQKLEELADACVRAAGAARKLPPKGQLH